MEWFVALELDVVKVFALLGAKRAESECVPSVRLVVENAATPPVTVFVDSTLEPSRKVTEPTASLGLTEALSVTVAPKCELVVGDTDNVVVVVTAGDWEYATDHVDPLMAMSAES
jgi:hypothetical protein